MTVEFFCGNTESVSASRMAELRAMLDGAYAEGFSDSDWRNALGGTHFMLLDDGRIASHVAVVERELIADGRAFRTGYLEAVATRMEFRQRGRATLLLARAGDWIRKRFELGALCTGGHEFYARLGWERWTGPTYVRTGDRWRRSPEEDDAVMILRASASRKLDATAPICCEWREGDCW